MKKNALWKHWFFLVDFGARGHSFSNSQAWAAQDSLVMVGGQAMYPSKTIVMNAINSADHTTLVAAVIEHHPGRRCFPGFFVGSATRRR